VVRITRDGQPVAGVGVTFWSPTPGGHQPTLAFDRPPPFPQTDAQGYARSLPFKPEVGYGSGTIQVMAADDVALAYVYAGADFTTTNASGQPYPSLAPLWWGGPGQSGWGVSIPQHGSSIFPVYFTYDSAGRPTWFVLEGEWGSGVVGSYFGTNLVQYLGSPYFAFDTTKVTVAGTSHGYVLFDSPAALRFVVSDTRPISPPPPATVLALQPFDFAPAIKQPERGVGDIWWGGPSQSGWGITIAEAQGNLFVVWFTYDAAGLPVWFSMSEGAWVDANTWSGPIYRTSGSPGIGAAYDPAAFRETKVGDFTLRFAGTTRATFDYSLEGHSGSLPLERFPF
jgi:hypothetical protein